MKIKNRKLKIIADSGSTQTQWAIIENGEKTGGCVTSGINPFFLDRESIVRLLAKEFTPEKRDIQSVYFYGSGCGWPDKNKILHDALSDFFGNIPIEINSDLLAAARSLCLHEEGVACILGTGSNSCYYDGKDMVRNTPALGYVLGDEGSGSYMGKTLIGDVFKNRLPDAICQKFFEAYPITIGEILENVYRKPFPNRYLAQYSKFIRDNIHFPEIEQIVDHGFCRFIERNILQYPGIEHQAIHFTGSIAYFFKPQLEKAVRSFGLTTGNITREPMDGLIVYHTTTRSAT